MAGHLRDWLRHSIVTELVSALDWQEKGLGDAFISDASPGPAILDVTKVKVEHLTDFNLSHASPMKKYSNDGSNLRIVLRNTPGKYVQVLNFMNTKPPYPAILSDGTSVVTAKFSRRAQDRFHEKYGRSISHETLGGLFLLLEIEIVLSLQPVQDQITLLICDAQFEGLHGSPSFGRPEHIGCNSIINTLVHRLYKLGRSEDDVDQTSDVELRQVRMTNPQVATSTVEEQPLSQDSALPVHTQFATQTFSLAETRTSPDMVVLGGINLQSPRRPPRRTYAQSKATPGMDESDIVLSKINKHKSRTLETSTIGDKGSSERASTPIALPSDQKPLADHRGINNTKDKVSTTPSTGNCLPNSNGTAMSDGQLSGDQSVQTRDISATVAVKDRVTINTTIPTIEEYTKADTMEIQQNEKACGKRYSPMSNSTSIVFGKDTIKAKTPTVLLKPFGIHQNDFRFVKSFNTAEPVSERQMELLRRPESWYHSLPGLQFPTPNIPIDMLDAVQKEAERIKSIRIGVETRNHNRNTEASRLAINEVFQHQDEGIDNPHSSEGQAISWPPSPSPTRQTRSNEVPGLPPDSSEDTFSGHLKDLPGSRPFSSKDIEKSPSVVTKYSQKRTESFNYSDLPDDSSDLEMEPPHALPFTEVQYQSNERPNSSVVLLAPRKQAVAEVATINSETIDVPISIEYQCPSKPGSKPPSPAIFQYSGERHINDSNDPSVLNADIGKIVLRMNERKIDDVSPIKVLSSNSSEDPKFLPMSGQSSRTNQQLNNMPRGLKRKRLFDESPRKSTSLFRHDLELDCSIQDVLDPAVAARQARHEFMKNKIDTAPSPWHTPSLQRPLTMQSKDNVAGVQSFEDHGIDSPNSYQPLQVRTGERPIQVSSTNPTDKAFQNSESVVTPMSQFTDYESTDATHIASAITATLPSEALVSQPRQARKVSRSSSPKQANPPTNERKISSADQVYEIFRKSYPNYAGNTKHFLGLCRKIHTSGTLHRSLWDDFIVRHKREYATYVSKCNEDGEEAISYDVFYNERVEVSTHNLGIVNPNTLAQMIITDQRSDHVKTSKQEIYSERPASSFPLFSSSQMIDPFTCVALRQSRPVQQVAHHADTSTIPAMVSGRPPNDLSLAQSYCSNAPCLITTSREKIANSVEPSASSRQLEPWHIRPYDSKQGKSMSVTVNSRYGRVGQITHLSKANQYKITHSGINDVDMADVRTGIEVLDTINTIPSESNFESGAKEQAALNVPEKQSDYASSAQNKSPGIQNAWWQEDDTPFKEFGRNYIRLRANAGLLGIPGKFPILSRRTERLNVLDWRF